MFHCQVEICKEDSLLKLAWQRALLREKKKKCGDSIIAGRNGESGTSGRRHLPARRKPFRHKRKDKERGGEVQVNARSGKKAPEEGYVSVRGS